MIWLDKNYPIEKIAADIFHDVMRRMGLAHTWDSPDTLKRRWVAVAELFREVMTSVQMTATPDAELRTEAEKMLRFVQGANLNSCELGTLREARERVYALRRAIKGK